MTTLTAGPADSGSDPTTQAPQTIVLIHGLWMTPRSWEAWVAYYSGLGHRVLTPGYPGFEVEVEALRADPSRIATLTITETVEHLETVIRGLEQPPIIIGHSFGGALTQLLLDRGCGAVGVAIDSVPTEGVRTAAPSQIRSLFPFLTNPANRHRAVGFTPEQFHYAFANALSPEESLAVWERYHIPTPGAWVWGGVLDNYTPGHQERTVNYANPDRAPLLFIAGSKDHIMPPAVNRSNADKYHGEGTVTGYHEFAGRSHYILGEPGWEEVADFALAWATRHATSRSPQDIAAMA